MSGIYIHIPFCKQACHYCDFHFSTVLGKKEAMLNALQKELELRKAEFASKTIETIYFGGGTPSVLAVDEIISLLQTIAEHYTVANTPEITLEANPDDLSLQKIKALAASPINRLSIGVQSFFEEDLKLMNRAHNATEALECLEISKKYFDNISIDLIYGIPGMSNARWQENIAQALALKIMHISSYALTVEPKTALKKFIEKGVIAPVDDTVAEEHFKILIAMLGEAGYENYEISNFAIPGFFSKNNSAYWQGKSYIGIGPSAHSYNGKQRGWNVNNNAKYISALENNKLPIEIEELTVRDQYNEYVMTGLRTRWGVSLEQVVKKYGISYKTYLLQQAKKHLEEQLLVIKEDTLLVTAKGKFLSDGIAADLFLINLE